jgi:hypothetical protein
MRLLGTAFAILATAPGCAQIFGLDETSARPADPALVSFSLKRYAVGAQVVVEPMTLPATGATYLIPDPLENGGFRKVPATLVPPNQWQAEIPVGTDTQLRFSVPDDTVVRHFALPQRTLTALYGYLGKLTTEDAPGAASFAFNVGLDRPYAAGESFQWLTVGTWAQHVVVGAELPGAGAVRWAPAPLTYAASNVLTGRKLERLRASDALVVLRYTGAQLTGQFTAAPFDQTDGANPVTGTMTLVPLDQSTAVSLDTTEPVSRLANVQPALGAPAMGWAVVAAPGARAGFGSGPALVSGGLTPSTGLVPVVASYGNPFAARDWTSALIWSAAANRVYAPAGLPPVTLSARLTTLAVPPTDSSTLGFSACLPTSVVVQGATLISDGLTVTVDRAKPVAVSFVPDKLAADLYQITLLEITNVGGVAQFVTRFQSLHRQPSWTLPNDVFEGGKMYTMRATCILGGFPKLAEGDLATRDLPVSTGFMDSGVFTVAQ